MKLAKKLVQKFGIAYKTIYFGLDSNSIDEKMVKFNFKAIYDAELNGNEYASILLENAISKYIKINNIKNSKILQNIKYHKLNSKIIPYKNSSAKLIFFVLTSKKNEFNDEEKKGLGLYFMRMSFIKTDKADIIRKLKTKYTNLTEDVKKIVVKSNAQRIYGRKNITISIPYLIYKDEKIKMTFYSLPKNISEIVSFDKASLSELTKKEIALLQSQKSTYEKRIQYEIRKARAQNPGVDIKSELKKINLKTEFKDIEDFRLYMANLSFYKTVLNSLNAEGFSLSSNVMNIISIKIENLMVKDIIQTAIAKDKMEKIKEQKRKSEALDF